MSKSKATSELDKMRSSLSSKERSTGLLKRRSPTSQKTLSFKTLQADLDKALITQNVGQALEQARKDTALTMQALGERMGISRGRISHLEQSDNIELSTLVRAARAMGYRVELKLVHEDSGREIRVSQ
jgi:ribosome-binding protein aMBF1 (putative translation factor)